MDRFTGGTAAGEARLIAREPIGRMGRPEEIAAAVVWLCPERASFLLGHAMVVDGGQTAYVTEGIGRCQRRGGRIEVIRPGDRVHFEPGEDHWHGAAPDCFMTHLAMQEVDESGSPVTWGEHVTDEEYGTPPA